MTRPLSVIQKKSQPWGCLVVFFGIFLLAGVGVGWGATVRPLSGILASRTWMERPCLIVASHVDTHEDSDGRTYKAVVRFAYRWEGTRYESDRYQFFDGYSSGRKTKQRIVERYSEGSEVTCWVNPRNPREAVMSRVIGWSHFLLMVFPLLFIAVGAGGIWWTLKSSRKSRESTTVQVVPAGAPTGPVVLSPESSPRLKFLGLFAFTLFWNGFIGLFIFIALQQEERIGGIGWTILSVFALIGLSLIWNLLGPARLTLQNPRPVLTLERSPVALGSSVRLDWRFEGRAGLLQFVQVDIEGREVARFVQGTDTVTEAATFYRSAVVSTGDPVRMSKGSTLLDLPTGLVPSFKSEHNEISWRLHVTGKTRREPSVDASFEIQLGVSEAKS